MITLLPLGYTSSFEFIEHQRQNCMNDSSLDSYHCHSSRVVTHRRRTESVVIGILVLKPTVCSSSFLDTQMIGTCSIRLLCRVCSWPTSPCQTGRAVPWQADDRAGPRPGKHVFLTYKNPFSFAVF